MKIPAETNVPYSVEYEIVIDSMEVVSDNSKKNVIRAVAFHLESSFDEVIKRGKQIVCELDTPGETFKEFSDFTKQEIIDILEQKCFEEILTSKTKLHSEYYIETKMISSQELPWN